MLTISIIVRREWERSEKSPYKSALYVHLIPTESLYTSQMCHFMKTWRMWKIIMTLFMFQYLNTGILNIIPLIKIRLTIGCSVEKNIMFTNIMFYQHSSNSKASSSKQTSSNKLSKQKHRNNLWYFLNINQNTRLLFQSGNATITVHGLKFTEPETQSKFSFTGVRIDNKIPFEYKGKIQTLLQKFSPIFSAIPENKNPSNTTLE